jgi:serine/threonine protein kinase
LMPDKIGKYELRGTLGRGAMGTVLDGWDPAIERRVAIKTVRLADAAADEEAAEALERFKREAQAAGRLSHANIVGVFDTGETDELAYIVMEFIEGSSLKQVLDKVKSLPPNEAAGIMMQVLAGLEYSHRRGVVHRDIKPANIMLTTDGGVKIADFGIARLASSTATAVGSILGTPAYMPPEQFLGEAADARSDIFAAGATLFHLLTGTRPYEGNATSIMTRVLNADAPPLPSLRSVSVSPAWDAVIFRAMAKKPEERFQSAAEFAKAVREALSAPAISVANAGADETVFMPSSRAASTKAALQIAASKSPEKSYGASPLLLGGGGLAVLAIGVGAWLLWASGTKAPKTAPPVITTPTPPKIEPLPATYSAPPTPPAPSLAAVKDSLAKATAALSCSFIQAESDAGAVRLHGIAGTGGPYDAVDKLAKSAPVAVGMDVEDFDGPYCPPLDVLAPILRTSRLSFTATDTPGPVRSDQYFHPTLKNMPFSGWVQVDYFTGDGTVFHVLPMAANAKLGLVADAAEKLAAGSSLRLGENRHNQLQPDKPFGTDMFVALASSERLFPGLRPQFEKIDVSANALNAATQRVRANGGQVAAGYVLVKTVKK